MKITVFLVKENKKEPDGLDFDCEGFSFLDGGWLAIDMKDTTICFPSWRVREVQVPTLQSVEGSRLADKRD
jgi:hypothetical protein